MKKYITIPVLAALAISLGAGNATAGDDEALYALGGFIGGVITTKVLDRNHHHHKKSVHVSSHCAPQSYSHGHQSHRCDKQCSHHKKPKGYYKTISVREWVPGCWETYRDRCGNRVREWQPGYYTYVKKRVWVEPGNSSHNRGGHHYARR